jgi:lipoprotein-anchoring transpeptidase ErfK/SrfK
LPAGVFDPACARVVQPGEALSVIADGFDDPTITVASLQAENAIVDANVLQAGAVLDVCPGNGLDDLTGLERVAATPAVQSSGVAAQQTKLNALFAGTGLPALAVDGVSGPFTRQQLCAARMALNLPISRADMEPGSPDEQALMAATSIAPPAAAVTSASRWILIDKSCQVMFAGEGGGITFVFKTSTGEPGWETSNQEGVQPFRYNPALDNNGWHNSSKFPVAEDNPLNGNMYKPIYFHRGQAIHGANNVPPEPASKGCARLRVENQESLVAWLGLADVTQEIYEPIDVIVTVQGDFV